MQEAIEGVASREAAQRISWQQLGELTSRWQRVEQAVALGDFSDGGEWIHRRLVEASANSYLLRIWTLIRARAEWAQRAAENFPSRFSQSLAEHRLILDAISRRDPEAAETAARDHVRCVLAHLLKHGGYQDPSPRVAD